MYAPGLWQKNMRLTGLRGAEEDVFAPGWQISRRSCRWGHKTKHDGGGAGGWISVCRSVKVGTYDKQSIPVSRQARKELGQRIRGSGQANGGADAAAIGGGSSLERVER